MKPEWQKRGERGENALQKLLKPLQWRESRVSDREIGKKLPSSRGKQQSAALFVLTAPNGVANLFREQDDSKSRSKIDLMLISGLKGNGQLASHSDQSYAPGGVRK